MSSLKARAACIGLGGSFSVVHDFFGHVTQPGGLSLRTQLDLLTKSRIDINVIRVGIDQMTTANVTEIDAAVRDTRAIYATRGLSIGRVFHWDITTAQAGGAEHIGGDDEAIDLADDWGVENDALDVFFVLTYAGTTIGLSAVDGPCDKEDSKDMEGSVVAIEGDVATTPIVLAHEVGHYLGLEHVDDATRLMNPTVPNGGTLTAGEGSNMRDHCFVKGACPPA